MEYEEIDLTKDEEIKKVQEKIEIEEKETKENTNIVITITREACKQTARAYKFSAANADVALKIVIYSLVLAIYDTQARGLYGYFAFCVFTFFTLLLVSAKVPHGTLAKWLQRSTDDLKNSFTGRGKK